MATGFWKHQVLPWLAPHLHSHRWRPQRALLLHRHLLKQPRMLVLYYKVYVNNDDLGSIDSS